MNPYEIHEAIARNATISYVEPVDCNDPSKGEEIIRATCQEIILQGIEWDKHIRAERNIAEGVEVLSVNDMILDYIAVHWAVIDK